MFNPKLQFVLNTIKPIIKNELYEVKAHETTSGQSVIVTKKDKKRPQYIAVWANDQEYRIVVARRYVEGMFQNIEFPEMYKEHKNMCHYRNVEIDFIVKLAEEFNRQMSTI